MREGRLHSRTVQMRSDTAKPIRTLISSMVESRKVPSPLSSLSPLTIFPKLGTCVFLKWRGRHCDSHEPNSPRSRQLKRPGWDGGLRPPRRSLASDFPGVSIAIESLEYSPWHYCLARAGESVIHADGLKNGDCSRTGVDVGNNYASQAQEIVSRD